MKAPSFATFAALALGLVAFDAAAQTQPRAQTSEELGKELVSAICTQCHQMNQITQSSGYTRDGWRELTANMVDWTSNEDVRDQIADYLAVHYPPNTRKAPKQAAGPVQLTFKEWTVPTLGQRARDPIQAPDGSIWWVGQFGNVMGRIDPVTGAMKEYELPEGARPHSMTFDANGTPWYTGNSNGTIGKLDPNTGQATVYKMPDPAARDPHTLEFDRKGILWFTLQGASMLGRLDPATGDIKLVKTQARSGPYGIKIDADGSPWFSCNARNCLIKVDPATMQLTEVALPTGAQVRRFDFAEDGMIWYGNATQGAIGRYNPKTGEIKEWQSPSGRDAHPYGFAVVNGFIWYNESNKRPDMLVRFDPRTETFQSWPVPSGGVYAGIVRNIKSTRNGELLIHQTSSNRIIQVTIHDPAAATQ